MKNLFILICLLASSYAEAQFCFTNTNYYSGSAHEGLASADFNNDGKPDIVAFNHSIDSLHLFFGDGMGGFAPVASLSAYKAISLACADFNQDGNMDIATIKYFSSAGSGMIYYGAGNGTFPTLDSFVVSTNPWSLCIGDLNHDAKPDIVVACMGYNVVSVLLNGGNGQFTRADYSTTNSPMYITTGDFDADGDEDVATTSFVGNMVGYVGVLLNSGTGSLSTQTNYVAGALPRGICSNDFNHDGYADLATVNTNAKNCSVLLSQGSSGLFNQATNYYLGNNAYSISIASADFNADGNDDIVVTDYGIAPDKVAILKGTPSGSFIYSTFFFTQASPSAVVTVDFNMDGMIDIATANSGTDSISILLNCAVAGEATYYAPKVKIYPNPASGAFSIELDAEGDHLLEMRDAMGRIVLTRNIRGKSTLNVNQFDNGIYFLQIRNTHSAISEKLIISR